MNDIIYQKEKMRNQFKSNNIDLNNLKSNYFLQIIFDTISKCRALSIIKYNKKLQNRLNLNLKDYKDYSEIYTPITIELIPFNDKYGQFINIFKKDEEKYFHIYFDNNKIEEKRNYINENDKISKIYIIIDYNIKSFEKLFSNCKCIKSINFKKIYRTIYFQIVHV